MNRVRSDGSGYTIVETMVFLAVSGALFLSAMLLINGQQRKTEFSTSVRDFDSKLQSVMGNVASGYYNNAGNISCTASATGPVPAVGGTSQGQSAGCTFIGQFIDLTTAPFDKFIITSYAGLRLKAGTTEEVQNLVDAQPQPIGAEDYNLLGGVTAKMKPATGPATAIVRLAITTTFNQSNSSGILGSGSSRSELHAYTAVGPFDPANEVILPPEGVQICLDGGDQVGIIVLNTGSTRVSIGDSCP